jgi:pimeloyl-ACP methyl ester carboxylesterase
MVPTFYGEKLGKVEIIYEELMSGLEIKASDFHLYDRGSANPDFTEIKITGIQISGKKITLNVDTGTDATGPTSRNSMGHMSTVSWFRDPQGQIYYGSADAGDYKAMPSSSRGYQTRKSLELKLFYEGQTIADARSMADAAGNYTNSDGWLPPDEGLWGKFKDLEDIIKLPSSSGVSGDNIHAKYYLPERAAESENGKYPLVVYLTGAGTSYWDWDRGESEVFPNITHNYGTVLTYDTVMYKWAESVENGGTPVIVLGIHDRVTLDPAGMPTVAHLPPSGTYDYTEDEKDVIDYFIENYNADPDHIIFIGNSAGTMRSIAMYRRYPGLIDVFISQNGNYDRSGFDAASMLSLTEWEDLAKAGMAFWVLSGETDGGNPGYVQQNIANVKGYYKKTGRTDEWIAQNIHYTVFPTKLFRYWGETDHSVTKLVPWHFFDTIYYGPGVNPGSDQTLGYSTQLAPGQTYTMSNIQGGIPGFQYQVYSQSVKDWALSYRKPSGAVDWDD